MTGLQLSLKLVIKLNSGQPTTLAFPMYYCRPCLQRAPKHLTKSSDQAAIKFVYQILTFTAFAFVSRRTYALMTSLVTQALTSVFTWVWNTHVQI